MWIANIHISLLDNTSFRIYLFLLLLLLKQNGQEAT